MTKEIVCAKVAQQKGCVVSLAGRSNPQHRAARKNDPLFERLANLCIGKARMERLIDALDGGIDDEC